MSQILNREALADKATILSEVTLRAPAKVDRSFELPRGLYIATAACYLGFLAILASVFSTSGLLIPMAIFTVFIGMFFAVPVMMLRQTPASDKFVKTRGQLKARGISTNTGPLSGNDAAVQVLILPVLIVGWGLAVTVIVALVA